MPGKRSLADALRELSEVAPTIEPGDDFDDFGRAPAMEEYDDTLGGTLLSSGRKGGLLLRSPVPEGTGAFAGRKTSRREALDQEEQRESSSQSEEDEDGSTPDASSRPEEEEQEPEKETHSRQPSGAEPYGAAELEYQGSPSVADPTADGPESLEAQHAQLEALDTAALGADLKRRRAKEAVRGAAVAHQRSIWDHILEIRILLQRALTTSHSLPPAQSKAAAVQAASVQAGYDELTGVLHNTLQDCLRLHTALLDQTPSIRDALNNKEVGWHGQHEPPRSPDAAASAAWWPVLAAAHAEMSSFRDASLDQWHRQVILSSGSAAMRANAKMLEEGISTQVHQVMVNPERLIARTQMEAELAPKQLCSPFRRGTVNSDAERLPDSFDDSELYQQLLKEFLEASSSSVMAAASHLPKVKKRRRTEQRSSKGRRLRFDVQDKLVNFMAPVKSIAAPVAIQLLQANLFGNVGPQQHS